MVRTIFFFTFFWIYMFASLFFYIPYIFFRFTGLKERADKFIFIVTSIWSRHLVRAAGASVAVSGMENLPQENKICFVSNHQGDFDIPILIGYIPKMIGFIAKRELLFIPILGIWMKALHCVFINRMSPRDSVRVIQSGVEQIKNGYPMVIFPEGTRSKTQTMRPFKSGSIKLALRSNALIVPVTIDGTYKIRGDKKWRIAPSSVSLKIHPSIDVTTLSSDEKKNLHISLRDIIYSGLTLKNNDTSPR